jgi:DnaJ-class molecular chaperone
MVESRTRCPDCRGTGIDRSLAHRYTTGGHNDRTCPRCHGECYLEMMTGDNENAADHAARIVGETFEADTAQLRSKSDSQDIESG